MNRNDKDIMRPESAAAGRHCDSSRGRRRARADAPGASRRDVLLGASALAATPLLSLWNDPAVAATVGYDPSMSVNLSPAELAKHRNPALLKHLFTAKPLVNRERANEIMDKHGLDALVATVPKNVYYLSSHDNAFYHTGIEHMLFAVLPRREDAPPALIIWGALLYHLDYRPTWMSSVQIFTAPAPLERLAGSGTLPSGQRLTGQRARRPDAGRPAGDALQPQPGAQGGEALRPRPLPARARRGVRRQAGRLGAARAEARPRRGRGRQGTRRLRRRARDPVDAGRRPARHEGRRGLRHLQGSADGEVRQRDRAAARHRAALRAGARCRDRLAARRPGDRRGRAGIPPQDGRARRQHALADHQPGRPELRAHRARQGHQDRQRRRLPRLRRRHRPLDRGRQPDRRDRGPQRGERQGAGRRPIARSGPACRSTRSRRSPATS